MTIVNGHIKAWARSFRKVLCAVAVLVAALAMGVPASAQSAPYKFDIGAGLGMSGYAGDASSSVFSHPGFMGEASFRYIPMTRWAIRGVFSVLGISGNTADMDGVNPGFQNYEFKSTVYDLGARVEFNFFPYGMGETYKRLRRWTPYLAVGLGCSLASSDGNTSVAFSIPMAVGVKFKVRPRFNLALEFAMTKVFGDHVDGADLSDLYTIKSSFLKNTDWFSTLAISFSYEFGPRCVVCNRID